eukprot:CAMPEP_0172006442 /NCGR_PEP_ID=MMETSP1041-20130122/5569_1 /TAXON_ID=464988 /ORGANISM="Hemiselmis andersenii, Strain CCMP439" /LENGTH=147 /DNA_ID=CAMNT_0012660477 /DNA_START=354 /DNA_END=794 /DNA_ORIENTATION=+
MQLRRRFKATFNGPEQNTSPQEDEEELKPLNPDGQYTKKPVNYQPPWRGEGPGRCKRCCKYFPNEDSRNNTPCTYHAGHYNTTLKLCAWTCCKSLEEKAEGCFVGTSHVECETTKRGLERMGACAVAGLNGEEGDLVTSRLKALEEE